MRIWLLCGSIAALLIGAAATMGQAEAQREVFPIPSPSRPSDRSGSGDDASPAPPPTPLQRAMTMRGADVVWALKSEGSWTVDMGGTARARIVAGHVVVQLQDEEWPFPITIGGPLSAQTGDIHHIPFSQVRGASHPRSGIGAGALNYLDPTTRLPDSDFSGAILQTDTGSLRVDLDDGGFAMQFRAHVVECRNWRSGETGQEPCLSSLAGARIPTGRTGFVSGWVCAVDQWERDPESCDPPLNVDLVTPQPDRENVNYEDPQIAVVFSEPVELATLENNFTLHSFGSDGARLDVTGEWRQIGHSRYGFDPTGGFELRSGIRLQGEIAGGVDGVQARDTDKILEDNVTWDFSTLLNLSEQWDSSEDQLRLHNFQVVRDSRLTAEKPTMTRLYLDWELHDDIHADWQPESYSMRTDLSPEPARISAQRGVPTGPEGPIRIWRDATFDDEDRRHARHTVNFFDWRPSSASGGTQTLRISPWQPWPTPLEDARQTADHDFRVWPHDPDTLHLHYTFAEVGAWSDGVPAETQDLASAVMRETARQVPGFFPHRQARSVGIVAIDPISAATAPGLNYDADGNRVEPAFDRDEVFEQIQPSSDLACQFLRGVMPKPEDLKDQIGGTAYYLLNAFRGEAARLRAHTRPGDVVVVFVPEDFFTGGTAGYAVGMAFYSSGHTNFSFPDMRSYISVLPSGDEFDPDFDHLVQIHLHELGHEFGLEHVPGDAQTACPESANTVAASALQGRRVEPIEGWRMAPSGLDGWNKSQEEGNAQSPDTLVSMMWPWAMPTGLMGILNSSYDRMQRSMATGPAAIWQAQATPPAIGPLRTAADIQADRMRAPHQIGNHRSDSHTAADRPTRTWLASASGDDGLLVAATAANDQSDRLIVTGTIAPDRSGLRLAPPVFASDAWPAPRSGGLRAELIDAQGAVIATAPVGFFTEAGGTGWRPFRASLPTDQDAAALVIREGAEIRARLETAGPTPRIVTAEVSPATLDDAQLLLEWTTGGAAEYADIAYSPSGAPPWQFMATGIDAGSQSASLPLDGFVPGRAPTLRLTVHDGLRADQHVIQVTPAMTPQRLHVSPPETVPWMAGGPVTIQVDGIIPPTEITDALVVYDAADRPIEWQGHHNPATSTVSILPANPGDGEPPYRLDVDSQMAAEWNLHLSGDRSWAE
ncbi:hypothetical protein [Fodinicurvata sp. EGI_FJ10296]|uniref:hypothetical protein n=1 Tax=Fodinicurvata sp. EGI_FJ10296 TaxID=3231908 RepID=UPI0034558C87